MNHAWVQVLELRLCGFYLETVVVFEELSFLQDGMGCWRKGSNPVYIVVMVALAFLVPLVCLLFGWAYLFASMDTLFSR